jgi:ATP-dependent DNA helicase DinG
MAEAVESALADKRHLIIEAGTGTGLRVPGAACSAASESWSPPVPRRSGQLFFKVSPSFSSIYAPSGLHMKAATALPAARRSTTPGRPVLTGLEEVADFKDHSQLGEDHGVRRRSEIKTLPSLHGLGQVRRAAISAAAKCALYGRCFITLMPAGGRKRHHHRQPPPVLPPTFPARQNYEGGILPDYHAVVFDEAHESNVVGQYFGVAVSASQQDLRRDIGVIGRMKKFGTPG